MRMTTHDGEGGAWQLSSVNRTPNWARLTHTTAVMVAPNITGFNEGDILAGKYRIDKILGIGGMGVVVAAHHIRLDERVAIKFLLPEMAMSGEAVARFDREARAAVKIKSEHVARVSDVGTLENGAPYMVMEYLEGQDLAAWVKRGPLPFEQAAEFVLQACEAIAEAHALGIIHRDLKPANMFVVRRPDGALSVKVLDFGISKMRGLGGSAPDVSITKTSAMMGSPLYMSPEQMQSAKDVDSRTDIWALGIILFELVTGASPFHSETMPELIAKILSTPPPPLASKRPDAPLGFEAVILRCIDKDRGRRYESVGQLAADLTPFAPRRSRISLERISGVLHAAGLSNTALATPPSSDPTEAATGGTQAAWGQTNAPKGPATTTLVLAGIGLAILAGGGLLAIQGRSGGTTAPAHPNVSTSVPVPARSPVSEVSSPQPAPAQAPLAPPTLAAPAAAAAAAVAKPRPSRIKSASPKAVAAPLPPTASPAPAAVAPSPTVAPVRKPTSAFDDRK